MDGNGETPSFLNVMIWSHLYNWNNHFNSWLFQVDVLVEVCFFCGDVLGECADFGDFGSSQVLYENWHNYLHSQMGGS